MMIESKNNIDTGVLLKKHLEQHRISKASVGRGIGRSGLSVLNYMFNSSIQTDILIDISYALKHNFFQDMANKLPADFTVANDMISGKDKRISELEEEVKVLKIQNEVLMKVRG